MVFQKGDTVILPSDVSKHIVAVLRMKEGKSIILTNGNGQQATAQISVADKYKTCVMILSIEEEQQRKVKLWMAVGFTKNRNRNEWFLEKLVEIGVDYIIPLHCQNSEREKMNYDRMQQVMIAAMIQSQRNFLPEIKDIHTPVKAIELFKAESKGTIMMAHCEEDDKNVMYETLPQGDALILIGPEGDFSSQEIQECKYSGAIPVTLGAARLRTETAVLYACTLFNQKNYAE